jgi:hypothetical protein
MDPLAETETVVGQMELGQALEDSEQPYVARIAQTSPKTLRFSSGQDIATVVAEALHGSDDATRRECTKALIGEDIRTAGDFVSLDWEDFNTLSLSANQRSKLRKMKNTCEMEQASRKRALTRASSSRRLTSSRKVAGFWDQFSSLTYSGLLPTVKVNGQRQSDAYCRWVWFMDFVVYVDASAQHLALGLLFYHDTNVTKTFFGSNEMLAVYMVLSFLYGPLMSAWLRVNAKDALRPSGSLWMSAEALGIDETFMAAEFQRKLGLKTKPKSPLKTLNSGVLMFSAFTCFLRLIFHVTLYIEVYGDSATSAFPKTWLVVLFIWQYPLGILRHIEWYSDVMVMVQYSFLSTACLGEFETRATIVLEEATSGCNSSAGQMAHAHVLEELEEKYLKPCFGTRSRSWGKSALVYLICALLCSVNVITIISSSISEEIAVSDTTNKVIRCWFWYIMTWQWGYAAIIQVLVCRISDFGINVLTNIQAPRASVGSAVIFGDASRYTQYLDHAGLLVAKIGHVTYCSDNLLGAIATFFVAVILAVFSSHAVSLANVLLDAPSASTLVAALNTTNATMTG